MEEEVRYACLPLTQRTRLRLPLPLPLSFGSLPSARVMGSPEEFTKYIIYNLQG